MSLSRAPVRLTTADRMLHASDLTADQGTTWCGLVNVHILAITFTRDFPDPVHDSVCPDCERIYRERYPDPATFNVHASDSDATVVAVLLAEHTTDSPGDFA